MAGDEQLQDWREQALRVEAEVGKVVVGQPDTIRLINVALFARGHVLLEGDVGVGKTTILRAFSRAIGGGFERVEGTIDLMPGDLIYADSSGAVVIPAAESVAVVNLAREIAGEETNALGQIADEESGQR